MKHILSTKQFLKRNRLERLFEMADSYARFVARGRPSTTLNNHLIAMLFYEASTRTRISFESAVFFLGGSVVTTENASQFSSMTKGESLQHTVRVLSGYGISAIVLRHPERGSVARAALVSSVPIINAGDGIGEHPTQSLLDLYTIQQEKGRIDNLHIVLAGDLKNGRTVHSLVQLLCICTDIRITLASPELLRLPEEYREALEGAHIPYEERYDLSDAIGGADVVYMTRVQKERFKSLAQYDEVKDAFFFDESMLSLLNHDATLMHPMPIDTEVSPMVESDPRVAYFRQAANGLPIRMALLRQVID